MWSTSIQTDESRDILAIFSLHVNFNIKKQRFEQSTREESIIWRRAATLVELIWVECLQVQGQYPNCHWDSPKLKLNAQFLVTNTTDLEQTNKKEKKKGSK